MPEYGFSGAVNMYQFVSHSKFRVLLMWVYESSYKFMPHWNFLKIFSYLNSNKMVHTDI